MKDQRSMHKPSNWDEIYCHEWGYPRAVFHWPHTPVLDISMSVRLKKLKLKCTTVTINNIIHILLSGCVFL